MRKVILVAVLTALFTVISVAQKNKPWSEWSKEEVAKILNYSPWGQTQSDTDTTEMFYSPTKGGTSSVGASLSTATIGKASDQQSINNNRADRGATNTAVSVNYHVRFLSAKPVREAISRMIMLSPHQPVEDFEGLMQTFVDRDFGEYIVLSVTLDSDDGRFSAPPLQTFASSTADTLKNTTYLERKDGKRLYLMDYRAPQNDGLGAKFVFPRTMDGKPFLTDQDGTLRFYSEAGNNIKLNIKYKLADMIYDGKLEY